MLSGVGTVELLESTATVEEPETLITHSGGALLVLGAAGSGKTRLILDRYRWLVERGTSPERIALLTPSAARADAARAALEAELQGGYSELLVCTPAQLAATVLRRGGSRPDLLDMTLSPGDRLAMLAERIDELPLQHHDFGGNSGALLGSFVRRIDRLKAELIGAEEFASWAAQWDNLREREFAAIFGAHERMVRELGACDEGDLVRTAIRLIAAQAPGRQLFEQMLIDDAQELDLAPATLAAAVAGSALTAAGDPRAALRRFRGAGAAAAGRFRHAGNADRAAAQLASQHCGSRVRGIGGCARRRTALDRATAPSRLDGGRADPDGAVEFWRCESERAQAQASLPRSSGWCHASRSIRDRSR